MPSQIEPFVRPVRIPENVPLCIADPPVARAGQTGSWKLSFELTDDVPAGTDLRLLFHGGRNVKGVFAPIQVTDPDAPGYIRIEVADATPIPADPDQSHGGEIALTVPDDGIKAQTTINVWMGERSGITAPTASLSNKMVLLFRPIEETDIGVPDSNAEQGKLILGACLVHITGNEISRIRAYAPSTPAPGRQFSILVRPEDEYGNVASTPPGDLELRLDSDDIEARRSPVENTNCIRLESIALTDPGIYRFSVEDTTHGLTAITNPVRTEPDDSSAHNVYWGYIHGHTELSDGAGTLDNYFTYMRDTCRLDFGALGDHDHLFETTDDMWQMAQQATAEYNDPDRFVTFLGYEWAKWRRNGDGDRNVYYLDDYRPMYRSDDGHYPNPPSLFEALTDETAIVIPHHPAGNGNHCDYKDHDPDKERLIEIFSNWGNSERSVNDGNPYPIRPARNTPDDEIDAGEVPDGFVQRALQLGWRVGFTAGGDDHSGHPGDLRMHGAEPWRNASGLFAVQASQLSRQAVWEALYERRCIATTGPRIILDFTLNDRPMGSELTIADDEDLSAARRIEASVNGTAPIDKIEIVRNNEEVFVHEGAGADECFQWTDDEPFEEIALPPAKYSPVPFCFYYLRVTQSDGNLAWASPIWISP